MITIARLGRRGRMGNQLYQYAFLRAVSLKTGHELRIPPACFEWSGPHPSPKFNALSGFRLECASLRPGDSFPHRCEPNELEGLKLQLLDSPDGTDFRGWFQERVYFEWCANRIRQEFRFIPEVEDRASRFIERVRVDAGGRPVVSLNVRRGDFLELRHRYRVIRLEEIQAAMAEFPGAYFVVGSDDLGWCRQNIAGPDVCFTSEDCAWTGMAISGLCDHNIISASTFAWWGAWLGYSPGKRVLYPYPWFTDPVLQRATSPERQHPPGWEPQPSDRDVWMRRAPAKTPAL